MGLEKIEFYRKKKGLTQKELSELSGVPLGTLTKIVTGETTDPKLETLKAIVRVLKCTLDDLDDEESDTNNKDMTKKKDSLVSFGSQIKNRRLDLGLTQKELADELGVTKSTLSLYESDESQPDIAMIKKIAVTLWATGSELLELPTTSQSDLQTLSDDDKKLLFKYNSLDDYGKYAVDVLIAAETKRIEELKQKEKAATHRQPVQPDTDNEPRMLPLYEYPASAGTGVFKGEGEYDLVEVSDDVPMSATFGVKIKGNSMTPTIQDGAIVWVRQQPYVDLGEICIVVIGEEGYCKVKARKCFESINPKYKPLKVGIDEFFYISGKVVYVENPE